MAVERYNELIYTALRENIVARRIPAGAILTATDLSRFFGVGRTPVRWALRRLSDDSFVTVGPSRGYTVCFGDPAARPVRMALAETDAVLPRHIAERLRFRNQRERLYPEMEKEVAAALSFGEFAMTEQDVAGYYGVSRTVVRELLSRLNRVGLIEQQRNGRWCAGRLTPEKIRHHYEMRILLEPVALKQAIATLPEDRLAAKRRNLTECQSRVARLTSEDFHRLETDLHVDLVLACPNPEMQRSIYRNQLPLINVHYTFESRPNETGIMALLEQHGQILDYAQARDGEAAAAALHAHLEYGLVSILDRYDAFVRSFARGVPPYMKPR